MGEQLVKVTIIKGSPLIGDRHYEEGDEVTVSAEKAANLAAAGVIAPPAVVSPWPAAEPDGHVLDIQADQPAEPEPEKPADPPKPEPPAVPSPAATAAPSPAPALKPAKTAS